ncbi:MAG: sensor histidine kinase [Alphaproteobacteria bacterium]
MPHSNKHVVRLITVRYWIALGLIGLVVTASYFLLNRAVEMERKDSAIVGLAAEQGFSAQRICFLSHALVTAESADRREIYRDGLRQAVADMAARHQRLSLREKTESIPRRMKAILREVYYESSQPLDKLTGALLRDARAILGRFESDPACCAKELSRLTETGSGPLVDVQKELFVRLRDQARNAVERVRVLGAGLWLVTLALLAVEVPLIFRPMAERAGKSLGRLENARREAENEVARAQAVREGQASFIRTMSHELRTPLNAILGMTQMIKMGMPPEKQGEYAQDIHQAGRHLLGLINDILELSRLEAGQVAIELEPTSLREELEWTVSLLRPLATEKNLELRYRLDAGLARHYLADGPRIRQVLVNLVGNALKFTDKGSVTLSVAYDGSAGEAADLVRFEVKDTGIGVPPEMRQRIFEEFQQADHSLTREHGGSGLGLAISSRLVKLMNGEIGLESPEEGGSVFWFTLPLQWVPGPHPGEPEGAGADTA